jgi:hypothetical protein
MGNALTVEEDCIRLNVEHIPCFEQSRRFFARDAVWNARALYSIKNYKQVEVGARTPWFTNGRWTVDTRFGWLDAPQVAYYGQGMADGATRANFTLQRTYATALAEVRPSRWSRLIGEISYDDYITKSGKGSAPSIETIYTESDTPGLLADPAFLRTEGTAAIDWRPSAGYARKGGYYGVTLANYADRDDTYSFKRMDGEIVQHLPILRENWVVSLRGRVQSVLGDDDVVPYFLLPELGSGRGCVDLTRAAGSSAQAATSVSGSSVSACLLRAT